MQQLLNKVKNKLGFLWKINDLLEKKERKGLILVFLTDLIVALFQSISILSIMPFISIIMDPGMIDNNKYLSFLYEYLKFTEVRPFMIFLGGIVLFLLLLTSIVSILTIKVKTSFIWGLNHRLSVSLLRKYLSLPYSYFLDRNTSDLGKNILSEVDRLTSVFLQCLLNMLESFITAVIIFIMLLVVNPLVTLVSLVILGLLYVTIYLRFSKRIKSMGKESIEYNKERYKTVDEAFGGVKYTKVVGKEEFFTQQYNLYSKKFSDLYSHNFVISKIPKHIMELIAFGGIIAIALVLLSYNYMSGEIFSLIGLFAFAGYRLMPALQSIYDSYVGFRFHRAILNKIHEDMMQPSFTDASPVVLEKIKRIPFKNIIELKNISFSYDGNRKKVLENVNLKIEKNNLVAFVGPTGSGKTTLVDIILGLLIPLQGSIEVDGVQLTENNMKRWQANIGYVPQDIYLMDDTIMRNIAFGIPSNAIDEDRVKEVCKLAYIDEFINKELPEGYSTKIGQRGVRLSGGQRQRLGIARALYHNPEILVFDEATSSLDNVTERAVLRAIDNISKLKTIVIIAHRLTTVKNSDVIYYIEDGKIRSKGTYAELLKKDSAFEKMVYEMK